jgi:hypothetical protein
MFMTVCEPAFIPYKSLRACSLDATWIRVFSDNPSAYEHFLLEHLTGKHARLAGTT